MGQRKSVEDFFDAAVELLEEEGFPSVTAVAVCDRVGVTRGSFYHHFDSFEAFVDGLMTYWEKRWTSDLITVVEMLPADESRFEEELLRADSLPHGAEAALRSWACIELRVRAALHRVDALRCEFVERHLRAQGLDEESAAVYADLSIASLVGVQMLEQPIDPKRLQRVLAAVQAGARLTRAAAAEVTE